MAQAPAPEGLKEPRSGEGQSKATTPGAILVTFDQAALDGEPLGKKLSKLVLDYSPHLVLFPPPTSRQDARPYPDGHHDYQPRPVEQLLKETRFFRPPRLTKIQIVLFIAGLILAWGGVTDLGSERRLEELNIFSSGGPATDAVILDLITFFSGALLMAVAWGMILWQILKSFRSFLVRRRFGADSAREHLKKDINGGLAGTQFWINNNRPETLISNSRSKVWRRYIEVESKPSARNRPTCYVHIVNKPHGSQGVAVQYWFFYFGDDMVNFHLSDWEMVTVFFKRQNEDEGLTPVKRQGEDEELTPVSCAYSCHFNGRLREWEDVTKAGGTHPVVYVARGSHANYFDGDPMGFSTGATINDVSLGLPGFLRAYARLKGTFMGSSISVSSTLTQEDSEGKSRDYVPTVPHDDLTPANDTAAIHVFPYYIESDVVPYNHNPLWDDWWWLRYQGLWGEGIKGPPWQGDRWSDPWQWAKTLGMPDTTQAWDEMLL
jgi:hypothetical protein